MCGVEILDKTDTCPLCNHVLEGDGIEREELYPEARVAGRKYRFLENLFLFISIIVWFVLFVIDYTTNPEFLWSFTVALGIVYANVLLRMTILGKSKYMTKILWTLIIGVVFLIEADFLTGYRGWAVNFALPIGVILWDLALVLLMLFINKRNWQSYIIDQLFILVICCLMVFLMAIKIITFPYVTMAAVIASGFLFLGTMIMGDRRAREELKRRFHV